MGDFDEKSMGEQITDREKGEMITMSDMVYMAGINRNPVTIRNQRPFSVDNGLSAQYASGSSFNLTFQSGRAWIDCSNSYLVFDIEVTSATTEMFGYISGGATSLLREVAIRSRGGDEIDRSVNHNLRIYHELKSEEPEYVNTNCNGQFLAWVDTVQGRQALTTTSAALGRPIALAAATPSPATGYGPKHQVCIPLKYVSPLFATKKLMPPHLASGLQIQAQLETFANAFTNRVTATPLTDYRISGIHVQLDGYELMDSVNSFLNQEFASTPQGLVYEYKSYLTTPGSSASAEISLDVRASVSMATSVWMCVRPNANIGVTTHDSFASRVVDATDSFSARVGSVYLPVAPIVGIAKNYSQLLYYNGKLRDATPCGVNYGQFTGVVTTAQDSPNVGMGRYCAVLNRNNVLDLAGMPLNNSQFLTLTATLTGATAHTLTAFLCHIRRAVCFMNRVVVET